MKKRFAKVFVASLTLSAILLLSGCSEEEVVKNELEEGKTAALSGTKYGDSQTSVITQIPIRGTDVKLEVLYDTGDLLLPEWRVTSNKEISMEVKTVGLPEGWQAYIEHVHADIILKSTTPGLDGIAHDSMDDSDHRVPTKGFYIDDNTSYHNIFSIEGYNCEFYQIWGYSYGECGSVSSTYKRLTESNIRDEGCYAEKLAVVYDVVFVRPDGTEFVRSVYSDVLIPLVGEVETVTTNAFTGEKVD